MILVVFAQDLDLAAEVVVRAAHELELAHLPMPLQILPLNLVSTFIVALDDLK